MLGFSSLFITFRQENLISPMVSHLKTDVSRDSIKGAKEGDNAMIICLWSVDKTAQGFKPVRVTSWKVTIPANKQHQVNVQMFVLPYRWSVAGVYLAVNRCPTSARLVFVVDVGVWALPPSPVMRWTSLDQLHKIWPNSIDPAPKSNGTA